MAATTNPNPKPLSAMKLHAPSLRVAWLPQPKTLPPPQEKPAPEPRPRRAAPVSKLPPPSTVQAAAAVKEKPPGKPPLPPTKKKKESTGCSQGRGEAEWNPSCLYRFSYSALKVAERSSI